MKVWMAPHTLLRIMERGATEEEVIETIDTGISIPAKSGRLGKAKVFPFMSSINDKYYNEKKPEVYYVIENDIIITVTVYVFYGRFDIEV